jgi:hypothetical protein
LFQFLEPIEVEAKQILLSEGDDVQMVYFFTKAQFMVGFSFGRKNKFPLQYQNMIEADDLICIQKKIQNQQLDQVRINNGKPIGGYYCTFRA